MNRLSTAIAATLLLALSTAPVAAQTTFHVSGGLNWAKTVLSGPGGSAATNAATRIVGGAALSFPVSGRLNLQLGADYSQKGSASEFAGDRVSVQADYIEAGALLDMALGGGEGVSLHVLLGPTFGYKMSCQISTTSEGQTTSEACGADLVKNTDGGVVGGLRAGVGISDSMDLTIGAFYNFGVLRVNPDSTDNPDSRDVSVRSRTMTARAGFAYRIG